MPRLGIVEGYPVSVAIASPNLLQRILHRRHSRGQGISVMKILRHRLIAGDTSRKGHLKLNAIASSFLLAWAASKLPFLGGASYLAALEWGTIALSCLATEMIMAPDVDCAEKWSGSELYHHWWKVFGVQVPHRSKLSHSLLIGLPLRAAWCLTPLVFLLSGLGIFGLIILEKLNVDAAIAVGFLSTALNQSIAINLFQNIAIGAVLSDIVHYTLDDYNPLEWLVGKGSFKRKTKKRGRRNARTRKPLAAPQTRTR